MKKFIKIFTKKSYALVMALLMLAAAVSAGAAPLTPALDIISDSEKMTVSLSSADGRFKSVYLKNALGVDDGDTVTVTSLPEGCTLRYNGRDMWVGEELPVASTDYITFDGAIDSEFTFTVNGSYSVTCNVTFSDSVGLSPEAENSREVFTYNNTSYFGVMKGYDADSEKLCFDIESYPEKGLLTVIDKNEGTYMYAPYEKCSGSDSFTYSVHDEDGNYSAPCVVNINIEKNRHYVFSDLSDSAVSVSAVNMVKSGIMDAEYDGELLKFSPSSNVTRQSFIVSAMKLFGADNLPEVQTTSFADDGEILSENKPYVEAALRLGFISGVETNGELYLYPDGAVTGEEACSVIGKILGTDEVQYVMADSNGLVSPFAEPAVTALYERGVFEAYGLRNIELSAELTRGQLAEFLYSIKKS